MGGGFSKGRHGKVHTEKGSLVSRTMSGAFHVRKASGEGGHKYLAHEQLRDVDTGRMNPANGSSLAEKQFDEVVHSISELANRHHLRKVSRC